MGFCGLGLPPEVTADGGQAALQRRWCAIAFARVPHGRGTHAMGFQAPPNPPAPWKPQVMMGTSLATSSPQEERKMRSLLEKRQAKENS